MASLTPTPRFQFIYSDGDPLFLGKLYTYAAGTDTPLATYTTAAGNVENTNPVILDAYGSASVWLGSSLYKMVLKDENDSTIYTQDNVGAGVTLSDLSASSGSSLVGFIQSGSGAVARTSQAKMREWVTPQDFGAVGDGVTDDTTALVNWAASGSKFLRMPATAGGYLCSAALSIAAGITIDAPGATLLYSGSKNQRVLKVGTVGSINGAAFLILPSVLPSDYSTPSSIDWSSTDYIGITLYDPHRCANIVIQTVGGFTVGYELYGTAAAGCAYNNITVGQVIDCKYGERLKTYSASGFVNENKFFGGRRGCSSLTDLLGDAYGTVLTWDKSTSYRGQNNNVWFSPCYEMGQPASATERIPMFFDEAGGYCRVYHARHESNKGVFAKLAGAAAYVNGLITNNVFDIGYVGVAPNLAAISETNGVNGNFYIPVLGDVVPQPVYSISDVVDMVGSGGAANTVYVKGPLVFGSSGSLTSTKLISNSSVETGLDWLSLNTANAVGVVIDVSIAKKWNVRVAVEGTNYGRIKINCFDSSGALLVDSGTNMDYVQSGSNLTYSAGNFGGAYVGGSDTQQSHNLTFSDSVKSARVMFAGGTSVLYLKGFALGCYADATSVAPRVSSGLVDDEDQSLATAKPDTAGNRGKYARGNLVGNTVAAAAVTPGWTCTLSGYLTPAWAATTAYVKGQLRSNGGNVYVVRVAGTSAGAGGPSGTGTSIIDNTVTWDFIGVPATFATQAVLT